MNNTTVLIAEGLRSGLEQHERAAEAEAAATNLFTPDELAEAAIVLAVTGDGHVLAVKLPQVLSVRVQDGATLRLAQLGDVVGRHDLVF